MAAILQQLSGNPFATPIGQKIEQATDPSLSSEDWNLNMEICDMINDTDEGPKDAVRAIKRRFQQNAGKNHTVIMYTLTILETCVKNCGKRFHLLITNKDFINDLVKLIGPKNDPPASLQEKVLSLIQIWSDAFRGQPDLSGVVHVYNDLKSKGIEFPKPNYDCMVPIHTPQRSVQVQPPNHLPPPVLPSAHQCVTNTTIVPNILPANLPNSVTINQLPAGYLHRNHPQAMSTTVCLTEHQLIKIKDELQIVNGNIRVFDEMLTEFEKNENFQAEDYELLIELNSTCLSMQRRIVDLIGKVANEEITSELLTVNDDLNMLFSRFELINSKKSNQTTGSVVSTINKPIAQTNTGINQETCVKKVNEKKVEETSLIDLEDGRQTNLESNLEALSLGAVGGTQPSLSTKPNQPTVTGDFDFDVFAQSRSDRPSGTEIPSEQEIDEMEKWLKEQSNSNAPASLSNSEFDKFLAERATNLEKQPNVSPEKEKTKQNKDPFEL